MEPTLTELRQLARRAGSLLRQGMNHKHTIRHKSVIDLVTEMDGQSEEMIIKAIRKAHPRDRIITEESGELAGNHACTWYIDPLDGTVNYSHGLGIFCVSIAYAIDGILELGVVYDPMRRECFYARRGHGAWLNNRKLHVSNTEELIKSMLVTGFPYDIQTTSDSNLENFAWFAKHSQGVRRLGSAALDLCYVAAGHLDGYWELGINPWDIAAGILLIQEAGGQITDLEGGDGYFRPPHALVAANPTLQPKLVAALQESRRSRGMTKI